MNPDTVPNTDSVPEIPTVPNPEILTCCSVSDSIGGSVSGNYITDTVTQNDIYMDELAAFDSMIGDFVQVDNFGDKLFDNDAYSHMTSLIYSSMSGQHVEFLNGRPKYFVKYHLIISVGSSKDPQMDRGIARLTNGKIDLIDCNIYSDYFFSHPLSISVVECHDKSCNSNFFNKGIWCLSCNGQFKYASQLKLFMHDKIKFTNIPRYSIIHIEKIIAEIDENDLDCVRNVKSFLELDKKKIATLQSGILNIEDRIEKIITKINAEKTYKQLMLDKMLSSRGGSIDGYINMIMDFDTKLAELNKQAS